MPLDEIIPADASPYLPGKPVILSRLPAQEWFTVDEVARYSGWSPSFIRNKITSSDLAAQDSLGGHGGRAVEGKHSSYRVHIDDLVLFILRNGNGRYTDEKVFRDVAVVVKTWPAWMRRELVKLLERSLTPSSPPEAGSRVNGTAKAQGSGKATAPGGAVAASPV